MRITDLCSGRGRSKDIQPPSRNDSPATGIAAENTILVPLCAGLGYGFGFGAPERAGQTQVTALDLRRFKPTEKAGRHGNPPRSCCSANFQEWNAARLELARTDLFSCRGNMPGDKSLVMQSAAISCDFLTHQIDFKA